MKEQKNQIAMKLISKTLIILLALVSFASCDLGGDNDTPQNCNYQAGIGTTAVTGATTAALNEEITLTVSFTLANNCGSFLLYNEVNQSNNDKIITVNAKFEGCGCDNIEVRKTAPYKFKAVAAGVYNLKFRKNNTEYITHTITVS